MSTLFPSLPQPGAQTGAASSVGATSATLNGTVEPHGIYTQYKFEYGLTQSYGSSVPAPEGSAGRGVGPVAESAAISGLQPGTTYHYRIVATNVMGTSNGGD